MPPSTSKMTRMNISKSVVLCGALSFSVLACSGTPPGGKPQGTGPNNKSKVVCDNNDNAQTVTVCWWESGCGDWSNQLNIAAQVCAVHIDQDILLSGNYPDAHFDGKCDSTEQDELPWPPCVCNYGNAPPSPDICDVDSSPGLEETSGQVPTTGGGGDGSESGNETGGSSATGDEWDTDGVGVELWRCSEHAHTNCQVRTDNDVTACWAVEASPQRAQCVTAATIADAKSACECLCEKEDNVLTDGCDSPGFCEVTQHLDFEVPYPDSPMPVLVANEPVECDATADASAAIAACSQSGGAKLFDATATLVLNDGTSANLPGIVGYINYAASGCVNNVCDLDVDILGVRLHNVNGVYLQGTTTGSYGIDDLRFQMRGSMNGSWYQTRGTVVFPTSTFVGVATPSTVSLDNTVVSPDQVIFSTDQIVGSLASTTSPLTLNLTFDLLYGTATFSLTTR